MKYVIFGVGGGGKRFYELISQYHNISIECFLDNNPKENSYCDIPIKKATDFLDSEKADEYIYIISSVYRNEIEMQLLENGVPENQIIGKIDIVMMNWQTYVKNCDYSKYCYNDTKKIFFDCGCGFGLGGVEKWTYNLVRELKQQKYEIGLISNKSEGLPPDDLNREAIFTDIEHFEDYEMNSIQELMDIFLANMPCTVFSAHVNNMLFAAMLVKQKYPDEINVVSVVHGGLEYILKNNVCIKDYVDYILCVSIDSQKNLIEEKGVDIKKAIFKETPIKNVDIGAKKYNTDENTPLRIAYAARLEKQHKHSELLIPLVEKLNLRAINYKIDVAGDGKLFDSLQNYIFEYHLSDKVELHGRIDFEKMPEFWLTHDVAINLSECEGCSLAMLESMMAGTVPVFTNVFSTEYFIHDGENGYITEFGDINTMADKLQYLAQNRNLLSVLGSNAHSEIKQKCNIKSYVSFIEKII